jgi:hypothetical protein
VKRRHSDAVAQSCAVASHPAEAEELPVGYPKVHSDLEGEKAAFGSSKDSNTPEGGASTSVGCLACLVVAACLAEEDPGDQVEEGRLGEEEFSAVRFVDLA